MFLSPADKSANFHQLLGAISFTTGTCATFNVTVPNFVGCAPTSSRTSGTQSVTQVTLTKLSSMPITVSTATQSIEQAMSVTSVGKVATFTGNALLAGSCTTPHFASVSIFGGSLLEFPIVGCSKEQPGCCPYDINAPGPLSVCPKDYTTTSSACCPSYVSNPRVSHLLLTYYTVAGPSIPPSLQVKPRATPYPLLPSSLER